VKRTPLIAIEGIDGTGKGTQARLLVEALERRGNKVALFSFPSYEKTLSGSLIAAYLNGEMGEPKSIDARLTAVLFALDRYELKGSMLEALECCDLVLCDRYVGSNLAHQVARTPAARRPAVRKLIDRLEYEVLGLPRPNLVVFLDMPETLAQKRVKQKAARSYTTKEMDVHEADRSHLSAALREYRLQAKQRGWAKVPTLDKSGPRSREAIHADVVEALRRAKLLPL
jgi:dTMP kinase